MRRAEEVKGHLNRGLPVALVSLWRAEVVKGHLKRGKFIETDTLVYLLQEEGDNATNVLELMIQNCFHLTW